MDADNLVTTVVLAAEHDFAMAKKVADDFVKCRFSEYQDACWRFMDMLNGVEETKRKTIVET